MYTLIWPDIFNGHVEAFFTGKFPGADRKKISEMMSIRREDIYMPVQKHTDTVLLLESDIEPGIGDALITRRRGILIGVQVADCVPVLLFDKIKGVIGAVHAGWRGTASKIIRKTITLMMDHFDSSPVDIVMALGPSIRGDCYCVGTDVKDAVCKATGDGKYYTFSKGKYSIDLASANMLQSISSGIPEKNIWLSSQCTYCNHDRFHSYRYHKNHTGRQGGFIGML
jgi:YfiH family protein